MVLGPALLFFGIVAVTLYDQAAYAQVVTDEPSDTEGYDAEQQAMLLELEYILGTSDEGLTEYVLIDGSRAVYLEGRFQSVMLATRNSDGTISHDCISHVREAEKVLQANGKKQNQKQSKATQQKPASKEVR